MTVVYKNRSDTLFPWKTLTLNAGYTVTSPVQYRVMDGICYLRGSLTRDAGAWTTTAEEILVLPDEAVPVAYTRMYSYANNNSSLSLNTVDVHPLNENLRAYMGGSSANASATIYLTGMSYATRDW